MLLNYRLIMTYIKKEIYSKTICKYSMKKHCHYNRFLNLHAEMWMTLSFNYTEKCNLGCEIFNQNIQISDTYKTANFGLLYSIYEIMILFFRPPLPDLTSYLLIFAVKTKK